MKLGVKTDSDLLPMVCVFASRLKHTEEINEQNNLQKTHKYPAVCNLKSYLIQLILYYNYI